MSSFLSYYLSQGQWSGNANDVYPFNPGHYVISITYRESLMALPGQGQLIDLR